MDLLTEDKVANPYSHLNIALPTLRLKIWRATRLGFHTLVLEQCSCMLFEFS